MTLHDRPSGRWPLLREEQAQRPGNFDSPVGRGYRDDRGFVSAGPIFIVNDIDTYDIILASGSPRRRELSERIGWRPQIIVSDVPEQRREGEGAVEYAERLAEAKARDVAGRFDEDDRATHPHWILSADTLVEADGHILEKPADADEAVEMLERMSGGWHDVITSFCWLNWVDDRLQIRTVRTDVHFRVLPEQLILNYVDTGEPMDKSGSYGIQDYGGVLVRELEGSYFNVVGLPICEVVETLEALGAWEIHPLMDGPDGPRGDEADLETLSDTSDAPDDE